MPPGIPNSIFSQFGARGFASGAAVWGRRAPNAGSGATGPVIPTGFGSGFSQFGREWRNQSVSAGDLLKLVCSRPVVRDAVGDRDGLRHEEEAKGLVQGATP